MRWSKLLFFSLLAAGCYSPNYGSGDVTCGANGECPPGQECNQADNRCYPSGALVPDAAIPVPDASPADASPPDGGLAPSSSLLGTSAGGGGTGTTSVSGKSRLVLSIGQPVVGAAGGAGTTKVETGILSPAKIQ